MARLALVIAMLFAALAPASGISIFDLRRRAQQRKAKQLGMVERLHSSLRDGPRHLPEQGYTGEPVRHENMRTATADFGTEYGPKSTTAAPMFPQGGGGWFGGSSSAPRGADVAAAAVAASLAVTFAGF
mmetsp:Transcript_75220/g.217366  ORF Transcript_75220/g.217366 Transcript_75220/m.217366 type:complete len:129 (+) Transcript_75220:78-464(+)